MPSLTPRAPGAFVRLSRAAHLCTTVPLVVALVGGAVLTPPSRAAGIIVPAYLPLSDATEWNTLQEDALLFKNGSSATYKDYWVVVTSANNGPFSKASDWSAAAPVWNPIRANGGRIFGYVHTMSTPTGTTFRPLADVKADISAWVKGYPGLDGIWLDEFYPRYEIAGPSGTSATFPNGKALATTDRSFLNSDGTFNANQVKPGGGYYSQLTGWIHAKYPRLKIVGNVGGQFYSNQVLYAGLVDVTCSFEQSYAVAVNAPANDWAGLNQGAGTAASAQAALIHSNSSDLAGAIDQSIAHGYKYFYTTDRTPAGNVWGSLPPYFTSEVSAIAGHN